MDRAQRALVLAACLPLAATLAGCVSVSDFRKLERDVRAMQQRGGGGAGAREQLADVAARLDSLQTDLQRLEGRIEVAERRSTQALDESRKARRDAQGAPETGALPAPPGEGEPAPLGAAPVAGAAPGSSAAAGSAAGTAAAAVRPGSAPPSAGAETAAPPGEPAPAQGASAEEVQAYRSAFSAWQRNEPDACIDQFRQFLQSHPTSIYADDGAYWMADCYFKKGDYKTAVLRFDDVVARYPKGNKAADALYRHGESLLRLGPGYQKAAQRAFERVADEYPSSPRAAEARKQIEQLAGKQSAGSSGSGGGARR